MNQYQKLTVFGEYATTVVEGSGVGSFDRIKTLKGGSYADPPFEVLTVFVNLSKFPMLCLHFLLSEQN